MRTDGMIDAEAILARSENPKSEDGYDQRTALLSGMASLFDYKDDRIAELEAQLAAERERAEKAEEKSRNLQMICAWLSTEVTEGWLVRGLGVDRISIRTIRDHAIGEVIGNPDYVCPMSDWEDRALAAEAERDAMREALRKIVNFPCDGDGPRAWVMDMMSIARAAIAGEETA